MGEDVTNQKLIETLMAINAKLASVESAVKDVQLDVKEHRLEAKELDKKVDLIELDLAQARGSVKALKWISGLALTLPGVVLAILKLLHKI